MRTALGVMVRSLIAAAVLAAPAFAAPDTPQQAEQFTAGAFLEAADMAETSGTADSLAFAARSVLAYCFTGDTRPDPLLLDRAERNAEAGLAIDPAHQESRLQLAIALALKSRDMGAMEVWNSGIGEKGRKLASEVLKANPVNYYAHGYLAVWHVEVRRRAGVIGSGFMGASVDEGRKHYAEAARLAPDDVGIHWQFARALAGLDAKKYRDEIGVVLAAALAASADDRVEQVMQERAARLAAAMQSDVKQAERLALELM
jgi:hypothetical protein